MRENKAAFYIIIVLLVISIPASLLGIYYKFFAPEEETIVEAPRVKNFFEDGMLNFYEYNELIGTYTCQNPTGYCGYAYETVDDDMYGTNYYYDGSTDLMTLIDSRYAFLVDVEDNPDDVYNRSAEVILYDVREGMELGRYFAVKNYTVGIENSYYIVQNEVGKWGVIQLNPNEPNVAEIIPFEYDFIGLQNKIAGMSSLIAAEEFIVKNGNAWFLINENGVTLTSSFINPIYEYDENALIVKASNLTTGSTYSLYTYDGRKLLNQTDYKQIKIIDKYVAVYDVYGYFLLLDYNTGSQVTSEKKAVASLDDVSFFTNDDGSIDIEVGGVFFETVN